MSSLELAGPQPTKHRRGLSRPPAPLVAVATVIALCFTAPFVYLLMRNITDLGELVDTVQSSRTWDPLRRSLVLATTVTAASSALALILAWLTVRTDLPGARLWRAAAPVPLVLPSFIAATALLAAFARGGLLSEMLAPLGVESLPNVRGYWGSLISLTIISYPYIFLPVAARLESLPPSVEEASRLLGSSRWESFRFVVWPQLRSSVRAGSILVFLYSLSDFGVVALLGYPTLTVRIFSSRLADTQLAFALAMILGLAALLVTIAEQKKATEAGLSSAAPQPRVSLRKWKIPAAGFVATTLFVSVVAPVVVLGWWVWRGLVNDASGFTTVNSGLSGLWEPTLNTMGIGVVTGIVAIAVTLPVAYVTTRYRTRAAAPLNTALVAGFALPGLVVALAMLTMTLRIPLLQPLSDTLVLLVFTYVVHFGAQAYRNSRVGVANVDPATIEAARTMGASRWQRLWHVEIRAMMPALRAGGGLVMLSTMKELPATLLLRPLGFDTLASRVWNSGQEGFLAEAGLASLILLAVSAGLTWVLVLRKSKPPSTSRRE